MAAFVYRSDAIVIFSSSQRWKRSCPTSGRSSKAKLESAMESRVLAGSTFIDTYQRRTHQKDATHGRPHLCLISGSLFTVHPVRKDAAFLIGPSNSRGVVLLPL